MKSVNEVRLLGNLGAAPRSDTTLRTGLSVCNFSIATNRSHKDQAGNIIEETQWHKIVVWGKRAENCARYLNKGSRVYIEGHLETKEWERDGEKKSATQIVASNVIFLTHSSNTPIE